jgi:hypothetical protein
MIYITLLYAERCAVLELAMPVRVHGTSVAAMSAHSGQTTEPQHITYGPRRGNNVARVTFIVETSRLRTAWG